MKLIITLAMLGLLSWVMPVSVALAANDCTITQGKAINVSVNIPTLRPAKRGTVGTVLGKGEINTPAISYNCGNLIRNTWRSKLTRAESTLQALNDVYNTNIPGLGIRLSWPSSRNMFFPNAAECISSCTEPADKVVLEFVQTGVISSGIIPAGKIGEVNLEADSNPGTPVNLVTISLGTPVNIEPKSCAILTPIQNVELGTYSLADFQSRAVRRGAKVPFNITLDCPQQTSLEFSFSGEHPVGTVVGYIANCDTSGCAKEVGVKLLDNSGNKGVNTQGTYSTAVILNGKQSYLYYANIEPKTTGTAVGAGKIDTSVVFNIRMN